MENKETRVAIITHSILTYKKFINDNIASNFNFKFVSNIDDIRGMTFIGYIALYDSINIHNLTKIIFYIQSRIKLNQTL